MTRKPYLAALAALSLAAIGSAYGAKAMENDALAIQSARIGLGQAVAAAEQHTGGKASRAEFERHDGKWLFDVEVVAGQKVLDVKVDPANGSVLAATEDKGNHDGEHEAED